MQSMSTHIFYNYLMNFYENEEIVQQQKAALEAATGKKVVRGQFMRFAASNEDISS